MPVNPISLRRVGFRVDGVGMPVKLTAGLLSLLWALIWKLAAFTASGHCTNARQQSSGGVAVAAASGSAVAAARGDAVAAASASAVVAASASAATTGDTAQSAGPCRTRTDYR